jgi:23S rRNA (guanine745-N1)-methyltransferase
MLASSIAPEQRLLDVGCGEGFHLGGFRRDLGVAAYGTDLSTPAIELAAKRHRHCAFTVANADRFVPYEDASIDVLTSITARMTPGEFHRVLRAEGAALIVIPAPDDLIELRAAVLGSGEERDRVERTTSAFAAHFLLLRHERFRVRLALDRDSIHDILSSSYRGLRARERERVATLHAMDVTSSRDILLFRKRE